MSDVVRFRPLLDFIAAHEGTSSRPGGGYNTSLGYGKFIGGEKNLTGMTLDQINYFQLKMLNHPDNHFNSSALGRYQIVRRTLLSLRRRLNLSGDTLFSPSLQDKFGVLLIKGRGRSVKGLRNEWQSLNKASAQSILAAYDRNGAIASLTLMNPTYASLDGTGDERTSRLNVTDEALDLDDATDENETDETIEDIEIVPATEDLHHALIDGTEARTLPTYYRILRRPTAEIDNLQDEINELSEEGWRIANVTSSQRDLIVFLESDSDLNTNEEDESISDNVMSLMSASMLAGRATALDFAPLGESSDEYVQHFRKFISELELKHIDPMSLLVLGGQHFSGPCKGKNSYPPQSLWHNIVPTAKVLDQLVGVLGAPAKILSAYRSEDYNKCIPGAAGGSMHKKFMAIDFKIADGRGPVTWASALKKLRDNRAFKGGIGVYPTFVHVDTRGSNANFGPWRNKVFGG